MANQLKKSFQFLLVLSLVLSYQNCSGQFKGQSTLNFTNSSSGTGPVTLLGKDLYTQKCSGCHSVFESSNLVGRSITAAKINGAFTSISAMRPMQGAFSTEQIDSIVNLFAPVVTPPPAGPPPSTFACASSESEKQNSSELIRLTGVELSNTYRSILSAGIWSSLANYYYLLPTDNLDGQIKNFYNTYTPDYVDQLSRFNEQVAVVVASNDANLQSFFGTCATTTSFTRACFDSFLSTKGILIFRSPVAADDSANIWSSISQATSIVDQQKIAVQIVLNDPRFLFHLEIGEGAADANGLYLLSSYEIANRISYGMVSGPPDAALRADAASGAIKALASVIMHVDRLAQTAEFKAHVFEFSKFYVGLNRANTPAMLADFQAGLNVSGLDSAADQEFVEYINHIIFNSRGGVQDLMSSKVAFPSTAPLAQVLGVGVWTSGAPMTAPNHAGLLARPYLNINGSPNNKMVQRGRRIRINMLCSDVPQPSAADLAARPLLSAQDLVTLNRRDYIDKATLAAASCIACHSKMNQIGFTTGNYDSLGRYIVNEKIYDSNNVKVSEHSVNTQTAPMITETDLRSFLNINDFQLALAQSDSFQQCLSRKTFEFFLRRQENFAYDSCRLNKIDTLIKNGTPLAEVLTQSFKLPSMLYKRSQ